jgi:transcriptional regulator with XRE-family HTH domain
MDEDATALARAIGLRVRRERQARRWTLERLAETAGVSRRLVVNVEQGEANPSVGTLLRISEALGIGLPALVEPPPASEVRVVRRGHGATLWSSPAGGRGVLLAATEPPGVVELWDWTLAASDRHASNAHSSGTKELLHVHEGTIGVKVGGHCVTIEAGDAVAFPGDLPHSYTNPEQQPARFSLAVFEPGAGSRMEDVDARPGEPGERPGRRRGGPGRAGAAPGLPGAAAGR